MYINFNDPFFRPVQPGEEDETNQNELVTSPKSLYSELEDGVLIEELPQQEILMPKTKVRQKSVPPGRGLSEVDEFLLQSNTSFMSRGSNALANIPFSSTVTPMYSQGVCVYF